MENRELKEYLAEFADNAPVSIIMANPKKRKLYIPEELFMLRDEKIGNRCFASRSQKKER